MRWKLGGFKHRHAPEIARSVLRGRFARPPEILENSAGCVFRRGRSDGVDLKTPCGFVSLTHYYGGITTTWS